MSTAAAVAHAPSMPNRDDLVEKVWELFASLSITIPILIGVSIGCVVGTFANPEMTPLAEVAEALSKQSDTFMGVLWKTGLYSFFELHDLYHSWWFVLLLVLLGLNLTACTIDRLPRVYAIALKPKKTLDAQVIRGLRLQMKLPFEGDVATEAARLAAAFRARGFSAEVQQEGETRFVFGESGRYSRFGVYVTHAALLLILLGGILGRVAGYEGTINVLEGGGTFDFIFLRTAEGSSYKHVLPTKVRIEDFRHSTYADGSDKSFESDLAVLDGAGNVVHRQTISVGHPMTWNGWTYYQASYQAAPDRNTAKLVLVDKQTHERREVSVRPDEPFGLGEDKPYVMLGYQPDFLGQGPAVRITKKQSEELGGPLDFWVFQNRPAFDRENRVDRFGLEFSGIEAAYFTGLQVARDPGAFVVFLGCFTLFGGLFVAFYTSHRRLWARVAPGEVWLAGATHKNQFAFDTVWEELSTAVRGANSRTAPPSDDGPDAEAPAGRTAVV